MSTGIEWTGKTVNTVRGCKRDDDDCAGCYAERDAWRFAGGEPGSTDARPEAPYHGLVRLRKKAERPIWTGAVRVVPEKLLELLRGGAPRFVFVGSMSDLFYEEVSAEHVAAVFGAFLLAPRSVFQVLTKRTRRMVAFLAEHDPQSCLRALKEAIGAGPYQTALERRWHMERDGYPSPIASPWPPPNVWLGASCGLARRLDRIRDLRAALTMVRGWPTDGRPILFASFEPLLEDLQLEKEDLSHLSWAILGGESGPGARPSQRAWLERAERALFLAGVPRFVKQLGSRYEDPGLHRRLESLKGTDPTEWPPSLRVRELPAAPLPGWPLPELRKAA
jgi:protein gp37